MNGVIKYFAIIGILSSLLQFIIDFTFFIADYPTKPFPLLPFTGFLISLFILWFVTEWENYLWHLKQKK